ncbi:MAG TPA: tRNA (adenosine(37)-N6)-threonylcarbamoyltransferase complex ATPase subunit type 1 TsaE [Candidatus Deferrimicrobiaceae bacterium]|nr:tRNA (adenosine(37)-N6)-threonylcarbamoyltransferase complex ATPase subunit type 1 TsaE [Candidatus Deferrimicrobiaceae bacterium]
MTPGITEEPAPQPSVDVVSTGPVQTAGLGARLAAAAEPGHVLCLWGELGAGKTVFAKGFGSGLGATETVNSPTFILMAEYPARLPLFHLDLYRLEGPVDAIEGGLLDERQAAGVVLVEWPDRLGEALPRNRLDVVIDGTGEDPRQIRLTAQGHGHDRYLELAAEAE